MQEDIKQELPRVLIVILNYNTYEMTLQLVKELKRINYSNYQVMVIDNCSTNKSKEILDSKKIDENYLFVESDKNAGYAAGNNIGIRYAIAQGYEYTWILNNDIKILDTDVLLKLVGAAEADENVACVGPKIVNRDNNVTPPYVDRPNLWSMTVGLRREKAKRAKYINETRKVYRVYGCCMLLKNRFMELVNGFDEQTFLYFEEDILAEKLLTIGAYSKYVSSSSILHMHAVTVKQEQRNHSIKRVKTVLDSMEIYLKQYRDFNIVSRNLCKLVRAMILLLRT